MAEEFRRLNDLDLVLATSDTATDHMAKADRAAPRV